VAQLNVKRAVERRKPQDISSVSQPFNPAEFNFSKVASHEVLFEMCNGEQLSTCSNHKADHLHKAKDRHLMIINVSPLEFGNCLIVPNVDSCFSQVLTRESIQLGIELVLLSGTSAFRAGFNSLCANASVNHHHFHVFYLRYKLVVETIKVKHLAGDCFQIMDYPASGFTFQTNSSEIHSTANSVYKVSSYLQENNIAHNLFITRGTAFDGNSTEYDTIRVYLWARQSTFGIKDDTAFNVACCELSGHLPIKSATAYETITEDDVVKDLFEACDLSFKQIRPAILNLFSDNLI